MTAIEMSLEALRRDGGTQVRAALSETAVEAYTEAIRAGDDMPAVIAFDDETDLWLADGFHRIEAHARAGALMVLVDVRKGSLRDAILYAIGANADHGLPRSREDRRLAVARLLDDVEWGQWSSAEVARRARVSRGLVETMRQERAEADGSVGQLTVRVTRDGKSRPVEQGPTRKGSGSSSSGEGEPAPLTLVGPERDPPGAKKKPPDPGTDAPPRTDDPVVYLKRALSLSVSVVDCLQQWNGSDEILRQAEQLREALAFHIPRRVDGETQKIAKG